MKFIKQLQPLFVTLLLGVFASTTQAATDAAKKPEGVALGSAGFNEMLAKQIQPGVLTTEQKDDGSFQLNNPLQTLQATVTTKGTTFTSTSKEKNKAGSFGLTLTQWGRENNLQDITSSQLYRDGDTVFHSHAEGIAEKFSNSGNGIQQDFIVAAKPEGKGELQIQLNISGATATTKDDGLTIALNDSQRTLTYDRLKVTDANNKILSAHMQVTNNNHITIAVDDSAAQYPLTIDPTVSDANWVAVGGGVSGGGGVIAMVIDGGGNLYIGGYFTEAAGVAITGNIAKWNGTAWSSLGTGVDSNVEALALDGSGNLYAGGLFYTAGGVSALHIAKWNGSTWSALGSGMDNSSQGVYALAFDSSGNLYAGGNFTAAGGVAAYCIAKWNGTAWSALGAGANSTVYALAFDSGGNLYVGEMGGASATYILKWNGIEWSFLSPLTLSSTLTGPYVDALVFDSSGNLYAGGYFDTAGSVAANGVAMWNGNTWSALGAGLAVPNGNHLSISALAFDSNGNLYAGGYSWNVYNYNYYSAVYVAKWNGSAWSVWGNFESGRFNSLALDGTGHLYVGGAFVSLSNGVNYVRTAGGDVAEWVTQHVKNDLDADADSDVMWYDSSTGNVNVWSMQAGLKNSWNFIAYWPDTTNVPSLTADIDGDGDSDILWYNATSGNVNAWMMQAGAKINWTFLGYWPDVNVQPVATGDFDGDGDDDILWYNSSTGDVNIWVMQAGAKVNWVYVGYWPATNNKPVLVGDFNGDGTDDILWWNNVSGDVDIWVMQNNAKTNWLYVGTWPDTNNKPVGVGDFNGDGTDDILWWNSSTGDVNNWTMLNSARSSWTYIAGWPNANVHIEEIGDFNGDGTADILWRDITTGSVTTWPMLNGVKQTGQYIGIFGGTNSIKAGL